VMRAEVFMLACSLLALSGAAAIWPLLLR